MERANNGCKRHYHPASCSRSHFPIAPPYTLPQRMYQKYRHGAAEPYIHETNLAIYVDDIFDITYAFTAEEFLNGEVNQSQYVAIDENGVLSLTNAYGSVGMKPLIKVDAKYGETVLATAYLVIDVKAQDDVDGLTVTAETLNFNYSKLTAKGEDNTAKVFDFATVKAEVYDILDIAAADFGSVEKRWG